MSDLDLEFFFYSSPWVFVSQPVRGKGIELHAKALGLAAVQGHRLITHLHACRSLLATLPTHPRNMRTTLRSLKKEKKKKVGKKFVGSGQTLSCDTA
jgi:hypothetical protein